MNNNRINIRSNNIIKRKSKRKEIRIKDNKRKLGGKLYKFSQKETVVKISEK